MTKKEIATISTGEKNAIRVQLVTRDENRFIDIRHIFKDELGNWLFTKKGIHVPPSVAKSVALAIEEALKQIT